MNPKSAITSINQVPSLHKFVAALEVSIFDFGAGKEGKIDKFYQEKETLFAPHDPFNRSHDQNESSKMRLLCGGIEAVTCANVLNVIEDEHLDSVIENLHDCTLQTSCGVCFVSVYHNAGLPKNRHVKGHFQRNERIDWYIPHLLKRFHKVSRIGAFLRCES